MVASDPGDARAELAVAVAAQDQISSGRGGGGAAAGEDGQGCGDQGRQNSGQYTLTLCSQ